MTDIQQSRSFKLNLSCRQEEEALKVLLNHGVDQNAQNNKGLAPLHITVGKANLQCTKLLLDHGASVNIMVGRQPLLYFSLKIMHYSLFILILTYPPFFLRNKILRSHRYISVYFYFLFGLLIVSLRLFWVVFVN